jgi:hypothetical protein
MSEKRKTGEMVVVGGELDLSPPRRPRTPHICSSPSGAHIRGVRERRTKLHM